MPCHAISFPFHSLISFSFTSFPFLSFHRSTVSILFLLLFTSLHLCLLMSMQQAWRIHVTPPAALSHATAAPAPFNAPSMPVPNNLGDHPLYQSPPPHLYHLYMYVCMYVYVALLICTSMLLPNLIHCMGLISSFQNNDRGGFCTLVYQLTS